MIIDTINQRVKMVDILQMYGIEPLRYNTYRCPFHDDKHPSAGITKTGKFHCFSCGWTGDQIDFVMKYENCDKKTAIKVIDKRFQLGLCKALTPTERRALEKAMFLREVEKHHKQVIETFANRTSNDVLAQINFWETVQKDFEPRFTEVLTGTWEFANYYFMALKNCERLNYIYEVLNDLDIASTIYEYIYPRDKETMISWIKVGKIII